MKLIYISPLRYPSEKAGSLFSMKSSEVFSSEGIETELWIPRRRNSLSERDPYGYFGVKRNFIIRRFPVIDLIGIIPGAFYLMSYTFAISVFLYGVLLKFSRKINSYYFYSHEQFAILFLTILSKETIYEAHDFPGNKILYRILFKRLKAIVVTNRWKSEELARLFHVPKNKIVTVPNAVDLKDFASNFSKEESRKILNLPTDIYLVGYVGALKTMGMEKGISILIDSISFLSKNYKLYIVGGSKGDIEYYDEYASKKNIKDQIIFAGNILHKEIDLHMKACDCLVAPYPKTDHYSYYMSPMKIFEYLASGRPMIVTDLPSVREIVDEKTAILVPPNDARALAVAVEKIINNKEETHTLISNARREVQEKYTWQNRARIILSRII